MKRLLGNLSWATLDPELLSSTHPAVVQNLVKGSWLDSSKKLDLLDPLNGGHFLSVPSTQIDELAPYI